MTTQKRKPIKMPYHLTKKGSIEHSKNIREEIKRLFGVENPEEFVAAAIKLKSVALAVHASLVSTSPHATALKTMLSMAIDSFEQAEAAFGGVK